MSKTHQVRVEVDGELTLPAPRPTPTVRPIAEFVGRSNSDEPPQQSQAPFILHYRGLCVCVCVSVCLCGIQFQSEVKHDAIRFDFRDARV